MLQLQKMPICSLSDFILHSITLFGFSGLVVGYSEGLGLNHLGHFDVKEI